MANPAFDARGFAARLAAQAARVDAALDALLTFEPQGREAPPASLVEAMRYGALAPGKRLRPFLVIETARALGREGEGALRTGAAVECLHAYSLIHDDLPAMDDDDLRRGRPTTHIAHGEALAILAGDALQTLAFEIVADPRTAASADTRAILLLQFARASGWAGMVGGQAFDMAAEASADIAGPAEVTRIQAMKTGALLRFSVEAGAMLAGASAAALAALSAYGGALGAVFQIADDLLDAEGSAAEVGKRTGKDAARNKATFVKALGLDGAKAEMARQGDAALAALRGAGLRDAHWLEQAALFAAARRN